MGNVNPASVPGWGQFDRNTSCVVSEIVVDKNDVAGRKELKGYWALTMTVVTPFVVDELTHKVKVAVLMNGVRFAADALTVASVVQDVIVLPLSTRPALDEMLPSTASRAASAVTVRMDSAVNA